MFTILSTTIPGLFADSYIDKTSIGCANQTKVNLIKHFFGGHHKPEGVPSLNWPGESGREYKYQIYPLGAAFRSEPANYILAKKIEGGQWVALYIAQTRDLHQRLEGREHQDRAVQQGATHIHVHVASGSQAARCGEERDLIHHWQPVCNDPIE